MEQSRSTKLFEYVLIPIRMIMKVRPMYFVSHPVPNFVPCIMIS